LNEAKTRLETQQVQLRQIIAKAREENDINTELEAQERLSALVGEQRQVAGWLQSQQEVVQQQQYQQAQPAPAAQPQRPVPSPRAEEWAEQNSWFGQDRVMTYAAWGIHQTLVEQEGVDPSSDEYYTELDKRVRNTFPDKFKDQSRQQRSAPAVAPAARSSGINSARRTVRLSPSQVAIAKKLGVPLEEYAKYVKE
jgi:phage I-like protein